jgi:chorismate dehydratase
MSSSIIRVGAVSYLNTKPLLWGISQRDIASQVSIFLDYPANLVRAMKSGSLDIALLPVAALPEIVGAEVVSNYGIAAEGNVVSVALFSQVPIQEVQTVYLDYQSRTSVRLAQILLERYWKVAVAYQPADKNYIAKVEGATAGVIIGDRALQQLNNFKYVYDLSAAWEALTGLHFVFAAWMSTRQLPQGFLAQFNAANKLGIEHLQASIDANQVPYYNVATYYTENIKYHLDAKKLAGLNLFLSML